MLYNRTKTIEVACSGHILYTKDGRITTRVCPCHPSGKRSTVISSKRWTDCVENILIQIRENIRKTMIEWHCKRQRRVEGVGSGVVSRGRGRGRGQIFWPRGRGRSEDLTSLAASIAESSWTVKTWPHLMDVHHMHAEQQLEVRRAWSLEKTFRWMFTLCPKNVPHRGVHIFAKY